MADRRTTAANRTRLILMSLTDRAFSPESAARSANHANDNIRRMTSPATESLPGPLTRLTEDERLFSSSVREFAERVIRPVVREMDAHANIPRSIIDQLFGLGVMGIEIPEASGGSGGRFFHAVLAVEELSRVDPSIGVLVDVQNTLVINAVLRWASPELASLLLPGLSASDVGAYALSEAEAGSDAFALQTRAVDDGDAFVLS